MNPIIKQKWIDALLSGEYEQGERRLRTTYTYCCLGVLCDLYAKETGKEWLHGIYNNYSYDGETEIPSVAVLRWAGFQFDVDECGGRLFEDEINPGYLASLNDSGYTFEQMAEIIKEHL